MRKLIKAFSILLLIALSFSCTDLFDEAKYTSHKITIDENIENGSVTADTESAIADTEITLIVKPNNGYELESLTVKDADENNVTTTVDAEDSTLYKFKMPASDVTVSAVFGLIKSEGTISFAKADINKTPGDSDFTNKLTNTGDGAVTYTSSDTSVATVDETTGKVTIKGEGSCTITATVQDTEAYTYATKTATYTLIVQKAAGTISFSTTSINKTRMDPAFTIVVGKTGDGAVTYTSSDASVATVDSTTGKVSIKGTGTCTITATVTDSAAYTYATKTATYTLIVQKAAGTISYTTTKISKTSKDSAFTNVLTKIGDGTVTYTSSNTNVATVNSTSGLVTIKAKGTCTITATVTDSAAYTYSTKTASYTLTVAEYVEVETYHEDFTSTRFYYVKDVYRTEGNGYVEVRTPSNPFVSSAKTRTQTTSSDWTEGSYVTLTKNNTTATFKSKTVTTYTSILYTKQSDGTYKTKVLGTDVKIDGIGEYGFLTLAGGETGVYYGTFFYTNKGWEASSNGKKSLRVNYDLITPTYQEIENYLKK